MEFSPLSQWAVQYFLKAGSLELPIVGAVVDPEGGGHALVLDSEGQVKPIGEAVPGAQKWQVYDATPRQQY